MTTWTDGLHLVSRVLEASPLVPLACAWVRRQNIPVELRPVFYYVGGRSVLYIMDTLSRVAFRNNVYIYHLATALMVLFLAWSYRQLLPVSSLTKLIRIGLGIFMAIAVIDAAFLNGLFQNVNSYSQAFGCALLIALAILHVVHLTRAALPLEEQPSFFLSVAVLLYCSCSIVTYVASNLIYNSGYDRATVVRLDMLISSPDIFLLATQMGLLAWMFCFFPLSTPPREALLAWLHYSRRQRQPHRVLGQQLPPLFATTLPGEPIVPAPSPASQGVLK